MMIRLPKGGEQVGPICLIRWPSLPFYIRLMLHQGSPTSMSVGDHSREEERVL